MFSTVCGNKRNPKFFDYLTIEGRVSNSFWYMIFKRYHRNKQNRSTEGRSKLKKSGNKTSSGEIGLNIRTLASPNVGQDQVSGGVSVPCWHATPVADARWKPIFSHVKFSKKSNQGNRHEIVVSNPGKESTTTTTTTTIPYLKRVTHLVYNNYSSMWPSGESCKRYWYWQAMIHDISNIQLCTYVLYIYMHMYIPKSSK